jgi:hypothetical protein
MYGRPLLIDYPPPPNHPQRVTGIDVGQGNPVTLQKSNPTQLTLWQTFLPGDAKTEDYSNTVELYDAVPKYFASKKRMAEQRQDGRFLNSLKQLFRHKGKDYVVKITPARIEEKDGSEKEYYPSWREELVEEALKKLACDQLNGVYLNGMAGVQFTLYELRKELKSRGHDIHLDDLLKSLMICRRAHIAITTRADDGSEVFMDSSIFPMLLVSKRREWEKNPKGTRCYVQFNPLVTQSITRCTYRQFDYITFMAFQHQLARWFHKRLSHNYTQASVLTPYEIKMSTIVRDSALVNARRVRDQARYIAESLDELQAKQVLLHYKKKMVEGKRGKIEDILYSLIPDPSFSDQIRKANARYKFLVKEAQGMPEIDREFLEATSPKNR